MQAIVLFQISKPVLAVFISTKSMLFVRLMSVHYQFSICGNNWSFLPTHPEGIKLGKPVLDNSPASPPHIPQIMFILVDTDETRNGRVIEYFHVTVAEIPAVQILNLTNDARFKMPAEDISPENLRSFCQNFLEGKAKVCFLHGNKLNQVFI